MLLINCSFFPGEKRAMARKFLEESGGLLAQEVARQLDTDVSNPTLLTEVVTGADQRFSHGVAELNFYLFHNPSINPLKGADQLLQELIMSFPGLASIDVQITYLVGIHNTTCNTIRRTP